MSTDLLAGASWECGFQRPGTTGDAADLKLASPWWQAKVPGTAAGALRDARTDACMLRDYDNFEWWFRCTFAGPDERADESTGAAHRLRLEGLATVADVWLNGELLLHSENMFVAHDVVVSELLETNTLLIRFAALNEVLAARRPRPRWRSGRLAHQNLRWIRTTLLGRLVGWAATPAPVGPWRPVSLCPVPQLEVNRTRLSAWPVPDTHAGRVALEADVVGAPAGTTARVRVAGSTVDVPLQVVAGRTVLRAEVDVADVELWWPHTHGAQPLYDVEVELAGTTFALGRVGFRTITVDRSEGGFTFVVNGVRIFARGTSWIPPDPVNLVLPPERLRHVVTMLREGAHNMVRVPGMAVWEEPAFYDLLDEMGILLWQDCMFAFLDAPDDPDFLATLGVELTQAFTQLQGRPSLALVCGGADTEEQAQFMGVPSEQWSCEATRRVIPDLLAELLPGVSYLRATPGDSLLPTAVNKGVAHYFGVGGYLRPISDARSAGVRFAAECLPVATPPDPVAPLTEERLQVGYGRMPDPRGAVHRDAHALWDLEDVRDHYTRQIFDVDVLAVRQQHPEYAQQLFRATTAHLYERVLSEWRRPGSPCAGALTLYGHDLRLGPGLGMLDVLDRPKVSWYVMQRLMQPRAVLLTDEGLSGLGVHIVNDTVQPLAGAVRLDLYLDGSTLLETATVPVKVGARGGIEVDVTLAFGSFRDLSFAHRFGEPAADVIAVTLVDDAGEDVHRAVFLPGGPLATRQQDVGLGGVLVEADGAHAVRLSTAYFAQLVNLEIPGWYAEQAWFDMVPGESRTVRLRPLPGTTAPPRGVVGALNSVRTTRLRTGDGSNEGSES